MSKLDRVTREVLHDEAITQMHPDWSCTSPRRDLTEDQIYELRQRLLEEKLASNILKGMNRG